MSESAQADICILKTYKLLPHLQETKRPSKEMQVTIARQLGLEPTTVGNFFMNARRRSMDKWKDDDAPSTDLDQQCDMQDLDHVPSLDSAESEDDHDETDDQLL